MKGYQLGFFAMTALCAGLVVYLLVAGAPADTPVAPVASVATAAPEASAAPVATELRRVQKELDECRASSWELLAKVVAERAEAAEGEAPQAEDDAHDLQQRALMQVALSHLRNHWKDNRASLLAVMQQVGTEAFVAEDIDKKVAAHRERFGLNNADAARLEDGYRELWADHGEEMQRLIQAEDWEALMDEVRGFWSDEDHLVGHTLGQDQRQRYRAYDAPGRTAIMAILATFSGQPWDESIMW